MAEPVTAVSLSNATASVPSIAPVTHRVDQIARWSGLHVGPEIRGFVLFTALVATACAVPYAVAAWLGPTGLERSWTFWFAQDASQYAATMREAHQSGSWLVHDHLTAEPHAPVLLYPLYVALGKLAAVLGASDGVVFEAAAWGGRILLAASLWGFTTAFLGRSRARTIALALTVASVGLIGWQLPLRIAAGSASGPNAGGDPGVFLEFNTFGVFLSAPHLMLGLGLALLCAPAYLVWMRTRHYRWLLAIGSLLFLLTLAHPFNAPVVVAVLWVTALLGRADRAGLVAALVASAAAAPLSLYNLALFQLDPFWSGTYGVQNVMPTPAPSLLPLTYGLPLLAAPLGWWASREWPAEKRQVLVAWVLVGLASAYLPVAYQRRFAYGVQPALAVLGALGLITLNGAMYRRGWAMRRRLWNYAVTLAVAFTPALVYASLVASAAVNAPLPVYRWSAGEAHATTWLSANATPADVVLASSEFGNALAGTFDGRVVAGHPVATRESARKEALVRAFYGATTPAGERARLLAVSGATLVALGPAERALGASDLAGVAGLERVYDNEGVQWYRVGTAPRS